MRALKLWLIEVLFKKESGGGGDHGGGGMNWKIGIDIYTLICMKWITNKNLLYKK